jgi:rhamnopyranosyl-N-acetylglucosaminyl-diphospho-decaprenol beta-1,3/1,4-galactofuranosyltransferase
MGDGTDMEADTKIRVAAVFATMNRSHVALACVMALAKQTRPPDCVVVADNASRDDTVDVLRGLSDLPFTMEVLALPDNVGNAGGVDAAMEHAFQRGMDAVWILDDDSYPQAFALEALLGEGYDARVVRHSMQIDPLTGDYTWPLQIATEQGFRLVHSPRDLGDARLVKTRIMWTGALVSRRVYEVIGRVHADLFIRGEDEEYPLRMERHGFAQEGVVGSVLDHRGPEHLVSKRLLGKNFYYEKGLSDWKLYYKVRNMVWLQLRERGHLRAILMALSYACIGMKIDGWRRFPLLWEAISDGWSGRLGRREE